MFPHPEIHHQLAHQRQLELQRHAQRPRRRSRPTKTSGDATSVELVELVRAAQLGGEQAWESLVSRFTPALRATAYGYRLGPADIDDLIQATWAAVFDHLGTIREPEAVAGWLMVTARREALRTSERRRSEIPVDQPCPQEESSVSAPEDTFVRNEQHAAVRAAVEQLPSHQRAIIRALSSEPEPSHNRLADNLGIPGCSLGPTPKRAVPRLRRNRRLVTLASPKTEGETP
jgi:RNA polymerase sigma factor (sigma-70 family)